ncbi:TPA: hypothetical protein HA270_04560, partial [Candidatus Woesearchaeota archaeon]|nr:hypothetical protein [Candidatus Woesearchaeota archaeon]
TGPPTFENSYDINVMGIDNETIVIRSWNATHYGQNITNLSIDPGDTITNIYFLLQRGSEANVSLKGPFNHSVFNTSALFNITANITILGADATSCGATLSIVNESVYNITSGETFTQNLGDISRLDSALAVWESSAKAIGSSNYTITSSCATDGVILLFLNTASVFNVTVEQGAPVVNLSSPADLATVSQFNITFAYNVTTTSSVSACSIYFNGTLNETDSVVTPNIEQNFTIGDFGNGDYSWNITCVDGNDYTGASKTFTFTVQAKPDLGITSANITFDVAAPIENQSVKVTANVSNTGTLDATNVVVRFYRGNYTLGVQIGSDQSINVPIDSSNATNVSFYAQIGYNNIFVVVDPPAGTSGSVEESDESNNIANNTLSVVSSQYIAGNLTGSLTLGDSTGRTLIDWEVSNTSGSNIYVADSDSTISFDDLQALGRSTTGAIESNDFEELDILINTTNVTDSIVSLYLEGGSPRELSTFSIFGKAIENVSIINSTNSTNFRTGILWDTSDDDSANEVFDESDEEDVVFITTINIRSQGAYGLYDYEIRIPATLRQYVGASADAVSIYAELR